MHSLIVISFSSKEEKKNRIKMEIARRRHQIDENACLHEELSRLAKLRENVEISNRLDVPTSSHLTGVGFGVNPGMTGINQFGAAMSPAMMANAAAASNPNYLNSSSQLSHTATHLGTGAAGSHLIPTSAVDGTSVLKSVDEILRETGGNPSSLTGGLPSANTLLTNHQINHSAYPNLTNNYTSARNPNHNALTSLHNHLPTGVEQYGGVGVGATPTMTGFGQPVTSSYDRVTDFSPIHSEMNDLNPMMNDMHISGNRSTNRLLGQRGAYGQPNVGM